MNGRTIGADQSAQSLIYLPNGQRAVDSKLVIAIMSKRALLKLSDAGSLMQFIIQGVPQFLPKGHKYVTNGVARENGFDRTIYNLRASSAIAMADNKALFSEALKAEGAGEVEKAHDLFNDYLNATQISFSIIENDRGTTRKFQNGDVVKAIVGTAINQTTNATSIIVDNVVAVAAVTAAPVRFSVEDLMAEEPVVDTAGA